MPKKPEPAPYRAARSGWIAGKRVAEGDTLMLTPSAAKYLGDQIRPAPQPKKKENASA